MGVKIPIGIQDFKELRTEGYLYVDKTEEILKLVKTNKYYFFPRPRRFGKSLLCSTLKYLFLGEKELFTGLYAESNWDWDNWYPVVYIDFAGWKSTSKIKEYVLGNGELYTKEGKEVERKYLGEIYKGKYGEFGLENIIKEIKDKYNRQVVILIDEYDRPVLNILHDIKKAQELRSKFRDFYSGIKSIDSQIRLFFLTGITKILKMSIFSVLNNLQDLFYSTKAYKLVGYTNEELRKYFDSIVEEIAEFNGYSKQETYEIIRKYYNGYNFGNPKDRIYNPWDINNLMDEKIFGMYWSNTGLPSSVEEYIESKSINVEEMIEKVYKGELIVSEIKLNLENLETISAEVLFLTSGYLTVKEKIADMIVCEFPNLQVEKVVSDYFLKLTVGDRKILELQTISIELIEAIKAVDLQGIKSAVEKLLSFVEDSSNYEWINRNPEGWLKTILLLTINLTIDFSIGEKKLLTKRSDIFMKINNKKFIIEIKVDEPLSELKKTMEKYKESADIVIGILRDRKEGKVIVEKL